MRFRSAVLLACALAVAGCRDSRREIAHAYLQTHPPAGFDVVAVPETIPVTAAADGSAEALASVRYRLTHATIETRDGFTLPRGQRASSQLAELRGWALSSLPAGNPTRESLLAAVAAARAPFPVKRIVTPAGNELDAVARVTLTKIGADWQVTAFQADATVPGAPDADPNIPLEDSPEVAARFDRLEATARQLAGIRADYLAARERAAAQSLAQLRGQLRAGQTFEGRLPDGTPLRLVIANGLEAGDPAVAVLKVQTGAGESAARFMGTLLQQPSGEMLWRSARMLTLSSPADGIPPAATDASAHPVLTLFTTASGLTGQLEIGAAQKPVPLGLHPAGLVDLIPDVAPPPAP